MGRPAPGQQEAEAALAEKGWAPFRSPALSPHQTPGAKNRPAAPPGTAVSQRRPRHCLAACVMSLPAPHHLLLARGGQGRCSVPSPAAVFLQFPPPDKNPVTPIGGGVGINRELLTWCSACTPLSRKPHFTCARWTPPAWGPPRGAGVQGRRARQEGAGLWVLG